MKRKLNDPRWTCSRSMPVNLVATISAVSRSSTSAAERSPPRRSITHDIVAFYSDAFVREIIDRSGWSLTSVKDPTPHAQHGFTLEPR
jgi:hypothetical protein